MDAELKELFGGEEESVVIDLTGNDLPDAVNLQMVMVKSSMGHEYTRKAFEKCRSFARKQELLSQMSYFKNLYYAARGKLLHSHPDRLESIERELQSQKQQVLSEHALH